jgi:D-tyrosyl-tRNA(Tyr) deacylase
MIGLLQRVTEASVTVQGGTVGAIGRGLMVLVGVERDDGEAQADRLLERLLGYRVFPDEAGKMNLGLRDLAARGEPAGLLLVPQFTLVADTQKGMRPSFSSAASPERGRALFEYLLTRAGQLHHPVAAGRFGADMQVALINDGPVTFSLQVN